MNPKEVQRFVMRYLEATECHVTEKSPAHVTVRLSPEADKDLTNRHYYWSFVERTGVTPETMTMTFVFDPEARAAAVSPPAGGPGGGSPAGGSASGATPAGAGAPGAGVAPGGAAVPAGAGAPGGAGVSGAPGSPNGDSILGRYFGFTPAPSMVGRTPFDEVTYGSRRLEQLFGIVRTKGKYVQMFEDVHIARGAPPAAFTTWLGVNYKVEFCCDMKRDELHSLGISLLTGHIVEDFQEALSSLPLTPRLPPNVLVQRPVWSIRRAIAALEAHIERDIRNYNHDWAASAKARLDDELARVDE